MKSKLFSGMAALALTTAAFTGFGAGEASARSVPIEPQKDQSAELFTPPNCEYVTDKAGVVSLECELPPQCEYVVVAEGNGLQAISIECDIHSACELVSGQFFGVTYWYIECDEPECIGGCDPVTPPALDFKARSDGPTVVVVDVD